MANGPAFWLNKSHQLGGTQKTYSKKQTFTLIKT
jgi:hypothetical protein